MYSNIAFFDSNGDGIMDAFIGANDGNINYFTDPTFSCQSSCNGNGNCGEPNSDRSKHISTNEPFYAAIATFQNVPLGEAPGLCLCYYNYAGDACQNCAATYLGATCSSRCPAFSSHDSSIDFPRHPEIADCVCNPSFDRVGDECLCGPGLRFDATTSRCRECPAGTHKSDASLAACESCPAGTFAGPGSPSCSACAAGFLSLGNAKTCKSQRGKARAPSTPSPVRQRKS